jgi:DNA-binding phage protein
MKKFKSTYPYEKDLDSHLRKSPKNAALYLQMNLETKFKTLIRLALNDIARAYKL